MEMVSIIIYSLVMAILLGTAIYDLKYQDVFLIAPLSIWVLGLIHVFLIGGGTIELLIASTSGLFLFVLGLMMYLTGSTGFGDALLFWSVGFLLGNTYIAIWFLAFVMVSFIPFLIFFILKYWKTKGYDIHLNGFLRQVAIKDLKEGMVLSQSKVWRGIKKDEIDTLRDAHGLNYKIWIKEGVPFAPSIFCGMVFILASGLVNI